MWIKNKQKQDAWRPNKLAFMAHHWNTPESTPSEHVKQELYETNEKFLRTWAKIGPLRPIFSTPPKVLAISMWSNTGVKPVKTFFEKMTKDWNFDLFGGHFGAFQADIQHTSKSWYTEHVKLKTDVKPVETCWENDQRPEFWTYYEAHKLSLWGSYCTHLWE